MTGAAAVAGWVLAGAAGAVAALFRATLTSRMESVARACHELRGPLTAARLGLELAQRGEGLSPARMRAIELELDRASLVLGDLSEPGGAADPRSSAAAFTAERVDVRELVADSLEAWRPAASAAGVELRMAWSGEPVEVVGERLRLAQATGNLIANAIEHGGGTVEVRGRAEPCCVRIEVLDHGPGLSAPLTELVRQTRRRRRRGLSGRDRSRGHGLAVAGAVAAAHGGRLAAGPSQCGARLVLELPVAGGPLSGSARG